MGEEYRGKEYKQLKDISLQDILNLPGSSFKSECLERLSDCGFIEGEKTNYEFGQHFEGAGQEYVLAFIEERKAALVNIKTGWTWSGLKQVNASSQVTSTEFRILTEGAAFTLVE